jgi:hypothetical protein
MFPIITLTPSSARPARAAQVAAEELDGNGVRTTARIAGIDAGTIIATDGTEASHAGPTQNVDAGGRVREATPSLLADQRMDIRDGAQPGTDAAGNGDLRVDCGETIEIFSYIRNHGGTAVTGAFVTFHTDDPYLELLHNSTSAVPDIAPGERSRNEDDWDLRVADVVPDGHAAEFDVVIATDEGTTVLGYGFRVFCEGVPFDHDLQVPSSGVHIDDGINGDSAGNDDGAAQCGETIELTVNLRNLDGAATNDVSAELIVDDARLTLLHNTESDYRPIPGGATRKNLDDWDIAIAEDLPVEHISLLRLAVTTPTDRFELLVAIAIECEPGRAMIRRVVIDDGPTGDSIGNDDGVAQCGETIEVAVHLTNDWGDRPMTGISTTLITRDPAVAVLHNSKSAYPDLPPGTSGFNEDDWDLRIERVPDGHRITLRLDIRQADGPSQRLTIPLTVACEDAPAVVPVWATVDDGIFGDSAGNNDERAQCGETIELYLALENASGVDLDAFDASLSSDDPHVTLLSNTVSGYPPLRSDATGENTDDWDVRIGDGFPDRYQAVFTLTIEEFGLTLDVPITLRCAP